MSSLYLAVEIDDESKQLLAQKQLILKQNGNSGEFEDPTRFHITVKFLAKEEFNCNTAMEALKMFGEIYTPKKFNVTAKGFYKFDQGVAWVGVHNSMPLYEIKYQIEDCFKKANFPMQEEKFDGYTPHITMAYDFNDDITISNELFGDGIEITVDNISLWNGFKANDVYVHNKLFDVKLK